MADFFDFIKKPTDNTSPNANNNGVMLKNPAVQPISTPPMTVPQTNGHVGQPQPTNDKTQTTNQTQNSSGQVSQSADNANKLLTDETKPGVQPKPTTGLNQPNNQQANLDLMTHLTQRSNCVMMAAQTKAKELKGDFVDSEHLLYGLTTDSEIYTLLTEINGRPGNRILFRRRCC